MTMSDRGIHPDLIDEQPSRARAASPPASAPSEPSAPAEPPPESAADASSTSAAETATAPAAPEWFSKVREAADPASAFRTLAQNLTREDLANDRALAGVFGEYVNKRAQALLAEKEKQATEQRRREAAQKGDLYTLGELAAPEVLERVRAEASQSAIGPFMEGVTRFQNGLPAEVQARVAGRDWPGNTPGEQVQAYLEAVYEAALSHGLSTAVDKEIKKREPALRKAWLSETNGTAMSPELGSGPPLGVREITDEQIARMSNEEYDTYFDPKGRPKAGVSVRYTRAIPIRQH
jgi:hypothetical protein